MIPKSKRFPMRTQFLEFRRLARRFFSQNLILYYRPSSEIKLAVVVPKKVNRRAVVRNRLKRLLKKELLKYQLGWMVVLVKSAHLEKSQLSPVVEELLSLLRELSKTQHSVINNKR